MADFYPEITAEQADLIANAPLFFVATADPQLAEGPHGVGAVNVSPRGGVPLHILDPHRVAFLDYAGSGNETARHALAGGPITVMVCSFETEQAAIVRLYGTAIITPLAASPLAEALLATVATDLRLAPRQVIEVVVTRTSTSCGYGVPAMQPIRERRVEDRGRRYKVARQPVRPTVEAMPDV